ncbi:MAG TPA: FtsX-like permease family protein [Burkholderiales bacterium]|nr:FtsX-like permease family protein [Burkholderiales bacterium]
MHALKLIIRNTLRHKIRTGLTVFGLLIAVLAYGLLQTVVDAWYAGVDTASSTRLIARSSISLAFTLPVSYESRIRAIEGVNTVARSAWFGGIYKEPKNFFPQFAISTNYLDLYPEFVLPEAERQAWMRDRRGALVGRQLADQYGFKVGDTIPLRGSIYTGDWQFVVRGIFDGSDDTKITRHMLFHWTYLNEWLVQRPGRRANQVGVYILGIDAPDRAAEISRAVDKEFQNSVAETLTETEQAFQLSFVSMSNEIIAAIRIVSYVVILIILAVMANTMAMSARERTSEYATLKALGFGPGFIALLIFGESLAICVVGGGAGLWLTPYAAAGFKQAAGGIFPIFAVSQTTVIAQVLCALAVGVAAAIVPAVQASRVRIVEGLRAMG